MGGNKQTENILARLKRGTANLEDVKNLVKFYDQQYKTAPTNSNNLVKLIAHKELLWRLETSVFSEKGKAYPTGYRRYCILGEYHNTNLFINFMERFLIIADKTGDITKPAFYGQPDPGYTVSNKTLIHIMLRHNETINSFMNPDSKGYQRSPSSFEFGAVGPIMLRLFMALNALKPDDWEKTKVGKNKYVCHFTLAGQNYTIVANGSKEIISFYPRTDDFSTSFVKLTRESEQMVFTRER